MKNRRSRVGNRTHRRRLLLQLLTSLSVAAGSSFSMAQETELAYWAPHPSEMKNQVRTVSDQQHTNSILQTNALQEELPPDPSISSSSDVGDDFLLEAPPNPEPESTTVGDIDAVVDEAVAQPQAMPQPMAEPLAPPVVTAPTMAPPVISAPQVSAFNTGRRGAIGATTGSYGYAPAMVGDFFGGTFLLGSGLGHTISLAGGDRRFKVAENVSPIPMDRVFFNYNHFHNALRDVNGKNRNLDRFVFGLEKTFLNGLASFEARVPFGRGLDTRQEPGVTDTVATEFGNLAFALKANLLSGCDWMLSGGTSMTVPTGGDFESFFAGNPDLLIENEAVHLAPFLGYIRQPNRHWFAQGFIQADFDLNGNDVFTVANGFEGTLQDQNLLFIDASVGRWLCRHCDPCNGYSGVAGILELHYTTTLNDTDSVAGISNDFNRVDVLNATGAVVIQSGQSFLRIGGSAPLRNNEERLYDAEIIAQLTRRF